MWLLIAAHALAAGTLIITCAVALQLIAAMPLWVGGLAGLLFYLLTLFLYGLAEDADE
ncbi:MAG TPA: hypothetical protein VJS44_02315 [Pyrinomonadaceae bacterium]|nr:hypothetical protein [Pyrinomonadaceae bacterium]